ncbi:MAG: dicarboxylate/amino acid:cation symporter [Treponema sp.]|nr:dicarboxylate/amino acid:cation symporter [Treponema sp.]
MENISKQSIMKNYLFLGIMLAAIIIGCIVGAVWPGATVLEPLGRVFINLMFCIVVPLVFCSIAGAVANMANRGRMGKILGTTLVVFIVTGIVACVIMIILMKIFPPVLSPWANVPKGTVDNQTTLAALIVNFFTVSDFAGLLTRRAMLPLIVFAMLFGFGVSMSGGRESMVGKFLTDMTAAMLKVVKIVTYYAPVAFFGFFASLVAEYGPQLIGDYGRAMAVYYPLCFIYIFTAFPLFAWFGGGKGAIMEMFRHLLRPAVTSLGTCSSIATIPTNIDVAEETGISKDVSDMVLPLGATMHMDGSCFSAILKIAFLFGVFGIPFAGVGLMIKVVLVAVFSSVAMSGIPGGGYIGEFVLCSLFFPDKMEIAYPIAITIGNLVDPPATMINSSGDYVVSFIVSRFVDGKDWLQKALAKKAA